MEHQPQCKCERESNENFRVLKRNRERDGVDNTTYAGAVGRTGGVELELGSNVTTFRYLEASWGISDFRLAETG